MSDTTQRRLPPDAPTPLITPELIARYEQDGVVCVRNALHPEWLMLLEMGLQRIMADPGQAKHLFYAGEQGEFIETIRNFDVAPEIQRLFYDSPIADMIGKLIGSQNIWLYSDEFFVKEGGACDPKRPFFVSSFMLA